MSQSLGPVRSLVLIPPPDRLLFGLRFVLATGMGALLVKGVLHLYLSPLVPAAWHASAFADAFVTGIVTGSIVGACQWVVVRRFLPDWLWILANVAGYVMSLPILQGWQKVVEGWLQTGPIATWLAERSENTAMLIVGAIGIALAAVCTVWLGLAQWMVVRRYASAAAWWVIIPSLAVALSQGLLTLLQLIPATNYHLSPLAIDVLGSGLLATVMAIAFCLLQRRSRATHQTDPLPPTITNGQQLHEISQQLRGKLHPAWKAQPIGKSSLTYWVGADEEGALVAAEPLNAAAIAQGTTPLNPLLTAESAQGMARYAVTFLPSGDVKIRPWRGGSLIGVTLALLALVGVACAIATVVGQMFPDTV